MGAEAEAAAEGGRWALRLTVIKSVPPLGWALLAYSMLSSFSSGAVVNVQAAVAPTNNVFLRYTWRGMVTSCCMFVISIAHSDGRASLRALGQLSRTEWLLLWGAGAALFINKALYAYTSLTHAALFDSTASIWLVVGQLLLWAAGAGPAVHRRDVAGVAFGTIGALICLLDGMPAAPMARPLVQILADEYAAFSGLGSCIYLQLAERLRHTMAPPIFYFAVLVQFGCYSLVAACFLDDSTPELSRDPSRGLLGWTTPGLPGRLLAQLWLAFVVDYSGNVGLIAVMKYVPALVVAAAFLLGPLVATAEGILLEVEDVPGPWTLGGGFVIVCGGFLIATQAQRSSRSTTVDLGGIEQ